MAGHESKQERHVRGPENSDAAGVQRGQYPDVPDEQPEQQERPTPPAGPAEGRDKPPAGTGRDPHSPWLGGG